MAFNLGPVLLSAQPIPPARGYSFTDWQVNNPTAPPPGDKLDSEFDAVNGAISDTIAWAATSLGPDGSLKDGIVGESQLEPGILDNLITENAAICIDYGLVTQAWAEYMPDTIPPNILAVMGVTGSHWSARWWANRAQEIVTGRLGITVVISDLPPPDPVPGMLWFDSAGAQLYLWYDDPTSAQWVIANAAGSVDAGGGGGGPPEGGPYLALAGGTMAGALLLHADPAQPAEAATKNYVDGALGAAGPYLSLGGGTMTGPINLAADPTAAAHASTKRYVDATAATAANAAATAVASVVGGIISTQTIATVVGNAISVPTGTNYIVCQDAANPVNALTVGSGTLNDGYELWMSFPNGGSFAGVALGPNGVLSLKLLGGGWTIISRFG